MGVYGEMHDVIVYLSGPLNPLPLVCNTHFFVAQITSGKTKYEIAATGNKVRAPKLPPL